MLILQRERKYNFICPLFRLRRYRQRVEVRGGERGGDVGQTGTASWRGKEGETAECEAVR